MAYYHICPDCGALLDPGERCDCQEKAELLRMKYEQLTAVNEHGQIEFGGQYEDYKNKN